MRFLITGICGYVGSRVAMRCAEVLPGIGIYGIDNLSRRGSETSVAALEQVGVTVTRGDVRLSSDFMSLPPVDWVIDCAANPSVMAGVAHTGVSSQQLVEHNLVGTLNMLEYCRKHGAGLVLLSSSRVYSIAALNAIQLLETPTRFTPADTQAQPHGFSGSGVSEDFPTTAPISLYGATKLASEVLALEYGAAFDFPVWVNRCGVIGGPGQFGRSDQGILAFWIYSCLLGRPLRYIGFGGKGKQVRDFVIAEDIADLIIRQVRSPERDVPRVLNVGGGQAGTLSLYELTQICEMQFGTSIQVQGSDKERVYDIPYYVTDIANVSQYWNWTPSLDGARLATTVCEWAAQNRSLVELLMR